MQWYFSITYDRQPIRLKAERIKYAKLLVGVVSEIAIIFLATNGEAAELVDEEPIF